MAPEENTLPISKQFDAAQESIWEEIRLNSMPTQVARSILQNDVKRKKFCNEIIMQHPSGMKLIKELMKTAQADAVKIAYELLTLSNGERGVKPVVILIHVSHPLEIMGVIQKMPLNLQKEMLNIEHVVSGLKKFGFENQIDALLLPAQSTVQEHIPAPAAS